MGFFPAIENHTHLPRLRKHLPILNRGLVVHVVGANQSVTFDDMQRVTVEIPRSIEPGLAIEIRHVDDQRIVLPAPRESPIQKSIPSRCLLPSV